MGQTCPRIIFQGRSPCYFPVVVYSLEYIHFTVRSSVNTSNASFLHVIGHASNWVITYFWYLYFSLLENVLHHNSSELHYMMPLSYFSWITWGENQYKIRSRILLVVSIGNLHLLVRNFYLVLKWFLLLMTGESPKPGRLRFR